MSGTEPEHNTPDEEPLHGLYQGVVEFITRIAGWLGLLNAACIAYVVVAAPGPWSAPEAPSPPYPGMVFVAALGLIFLLRNRSHRLRAWVVLAGTAGAFLISILGPHPRVVTLMLGLTTLLWSWTFLGTRVAHRALVAMAASLLLTAPAQMLGWLPTESGPQGAWAVVVSSLLPAAALLMLGLLLLCTVDHLVKIVSQGARGTQSLNSRLRADMDALALAQRARAEAEQKLQDVERLDALGRIAGGVAHDFNNTLTIIFACSDLLRANTPDNDPDCQAALDDLDDAADSASELTSQLLAFGRRSLIKPAAVAPADLLRKTAKLLHRLLPENIEMVVQAADNLPAIWADPGQLQQALINLATNARDAMPEGGRIRMAARSGPCPVHMRGRLPHASEVVQISVQDEGVGMDDETRQRIFEPFFTTKAEGKGSGLGLAMVHGLMKQLEGEVEIHAAPDEGTEVRLFLRATEHAARPDDARQAQQGLLHWRDVSVLVAEDQDRVREAIIDPLERAGLQVLSAQDGSDACRLIETRSWQFDLLITDVVMPGAGGQRVASVFQDHYPDAAVIFTSGYVPDEALRESMRRGSVRMLQKPFREPQLLETVNGVLLDNNGTRHKSEAPGADLTGRHEGSSRAPRRAST